MPATEDLVSVFEIAEIARVTPPAVANWRKRHADFPTPVADLRSGPVFSLSQVKSWLRKRKFPMATVISVINLKGGVGKTTTTVAVAEMLSAAFRKKVLVIDLDPQTNATTMLIGEEKWKELNKANHTLARLFKDALDPANKLFDLKKTLQRNVSNVADVQSIDLLPSSIDLIEVQDRIASMPTGQFYAENPIEILRKAVKPIIDEYDLVLIDCPPNLGIITLNGLRISMGYVIPTIPDILSTYGIPQIVKRVGDFSAAITETIEPLGIIISKYRGQSPVHKNIKRQLAAERDAPLFKTIVPENTQIAAAAEFVQVSTLKQKWGYRGQYDAYRALADELLQRVTP
jgi:chromosome partitioning protein